MDRSVVELERQRARDHQRRRPVVEPAEAARLAFAREVAAALGAAGPGIDAGRGRHLELVAGVAQAERDRVAVDLQVGHEACEQGLPRRVGLAPVAHLDHHPLTERRVVDRQEIVVALRVGQTHLAEPDGDRLADAVAANDRAVEPECLLERAEERLVGRLVGDPRDQLVGGRIDAHLPVELRLAVAAEHEPVLRPLAQAREPDGIEAEIHGLKSQVAAGDLGNPARRNGRAVVLVAAPSILDDVEIAGSARQTGKRSIRSSRPSGSNRHGRARRRRDVNTFHARASGAAATASERHCGVVGTPGSTGPAITEAAWATGTDLGHPEPCRCARGKSPTREKHIEARAARGGSVGSIGSPV